MKKIVPTWLPHFLLLTVALWLLTVPPLTPGTAHAQEHHEQDEIFTRVQVSDRVWALYGRGGNIGIIETDEGVIVIDTQFRDIAPGAIEQIRQVTDQPIRYIINTHLHGDHVDGNPVFQEYGDVVAHQNTYDHLMKSWEGEDPPKRGDGLPQLTFDKEMRFYLGGLEIQTFHMTNGHTNSDVVVWIPEENVMHTGDLLFNEIIPYVLPQHGAHTGEWMQFIAGILPMLNDETTVIPGHGKVTDSKALGIMSDYFRTIRQAVADALKSGKSKEEILGMTFPDEFFASWDGQERVQMTLETAYSELADK
jgi:glyoxylase-like metal-dependent hydrolase (beta-lactamase superfamily II)